jgi:hypothetical protein
VGMAGASVTGSLVDVGRPGAGLAAVGGEADERFPQLLVAAVPEGDVVFLAAGPGGGRDSGGGGQRVVVGEAARQSPIWAGSRAARLVPTRGSLVKTAAS